LTGSALNKILLLACSQSIWFPQIFALACYATACNHFHSDSLHLSSAQLCSSTSSLSHSTFLLGVQSSTGKKFATAHKTAIHSRTPMKSNIVIILLRSKKYYHVVTALIKAETLETFAF